MPVTPRTETRAEEINDEAVTLFARPRISGLFGLVGSVGPLDLYPGIEPYGNEFYQTGFPLRARSNW
jgi:hypothetical protein